MTLSGLMSTSDSMFPGIFKAMAPSPDEMEDAYRKMQLDRRVSLEAYRTAVFDMHSPSDRRKYEKLMVDLSSRAQAKQVHVLVHERKMLPRKDGSAGWFNYLEWLEFRLDETPIATAGAKQ